MASLGASEPHTAGRRGSPNSRQRRSSSSWTHATPAGLPWGMPGIGLLIDGAMQQAPQPGRQVGVGGLTAGLSAAAPDEMLGGL